MSIAETAILAVELKLGTTGSFKGATGEIQNLETAAASGNMRTGLLSRGFGAAETAAGKFGGALGHAKSQIGGLISGPLGILGLSAGLFTVGGALEQGISKAQALGQTVVRLSAITGLDTQTTSALSVAMEHFNVTADSQIRLVGFLEKNVGLLAARKNGLADFQKTFGLALTDSNGKIKDANELILTLSDYWNNKGIPATEKAAAMSKLLGRSWQELIPFLTAGRSGIAAAEDEAAKFGLTLSKDDIAALKEAKTASRDWNTALAGLETRIGLAVLPAVTGLARTLTQFVAENRTKIVGFFQDAAKFAGELGSAVQQWVIPAFQKIAGAWNAVPKEVRDLVIAGFIGNKIIKWTFGFSPIKFATDALGGLVKGFFGRGGTPVTPLFVADVTGGLGKGALGGGLLGAGGWAAVGKLIGGAFAVVAAAELADLIHGAISPGGGLEGRTNTGTLLPADQLSWPFGPKNTPHVDLGPFKNIFGGDSAFVVPPTTPPAPSGLPAAEAIASGKTGALPSGLPAAELIARALAIAPAHIASALDKEFRGLRDALAHSQGTAEIRKAMQATLDFIVKRGRGDVSGAETALAGLKTALSHTHDPKLEAELKSAIHKVEEKIVGREYANKELALATKILGSNESAVRKAAEIKTIEQQLKDHGLPKVAAQIQAKLDAAKAGIVTAIHNQKLSVTVQNQQSTSVIVNSRDILRSQQSYSKFYSSSKQVGTA